MAGNDSLTGRKEEEEEGGSAHLAAAATVVGAAAATAEGEHEEEEETQKSAPHPWKQEDQLQDQVRRLVQEPSSSPPSPSAIASSLSSRLPSPTATSSSTSPVSSAPPAPPSSSSLSSSPSCSVTTSGREVAVRHITQIYSWDCGLACLRMILDYVGYTLASQKEILAQIETNSVWTVDLLFALKDYARTTGRVVLFATKTPGVCGEYAEVAFYARALEQDSERIQRLFRSAHQHGLQIFEGGLSWQSLRDMLWTGRVLIVVLVDSRHIPGPEGVTCPASFEGHYILLTGFRDGAFTYQDPAFPPSPRNRCNSSQGEGSKPVIMPTRQRSRSLMPSALDLARKSFGTDEDVLVVEVAPPIVPMATVGVVTTSAERL